MELAPVALEREGAQAVAQGIEIGGHHASKAARPPAVSARHAAIAKRGAWLAGVAWRRPASQPRA